jgi:protein-glutamine gamma-glutamyltransferase
MKLDKRNNLLYFPMILYLFSMAPFLGQHNSVTLMISGVGVLLSLILNQKNIQLPILLRYGFVAFSTIAVFRSFGSLKGLEAGTGLLSILAVIKLFEMKKPRDFFIFVLIIELLLVGHLLSADSLAVLIYVLVLSVILFYFLSIFNKKNEFHLDRERIKITLKVFLYSIPLAAILFFAFPRLYLGNLFTSNVKEKGLMGFSERLRPGDMAELATSEEDIFRAKVNGKPLSQFDMYWRGAVLTRTDGFNWVPGYTKSRHFYKFLEDQEKFSYEVDMDKLENTQLFLLEESTNVQVMSRGKIERLAGHSYKVAPYNNQKIRYKAKVVETDFLPLGEKEQKVYLQLPRTISKRVRDLARKMSEGKSFEEKVQSVKDHFYQKDFEYTLAPGKYEGERPLEEFLFVRKKGFCEHYSSAAAILFRLMGIHTRVLAGFQGGEFNPIGNYYLIQGRDAHAWVELFDPKKGWIRVDPTSWIAPNRIRLGSNAFFNGLVRPENLTEEEFIAGLNNSFLKKLKFTIDMYYYEMNRNFLGYDYDAQKDFFKKFGFEYRRPFHLFLFCLFLCAVVTISVILYQGRKIDNRPDFEKSWDLFLSILKKKNVEFDSYMGPDTIHQKTKLQISCGPEVSKVFYLYISLKYGAQFDETKARQFDAAVQEATQLMGQQV